MAESEMPRTDADAADADATADSDATADTAAFSINEPKIMLVLKNTKIEIPPRTNSNPLTLEFNVVQNQIRRDGNTGAAAVLQLNIECNDVKLQMHGKCKAGSDNLNFSHEQYIAGPSCIEFRPKHITSYTNANELTSEKTVNYAINLIFDNTFSMLRNKSITLEAKLYTENFDSFTAETGRDISLLKAATPSWLVSLPGIHFKIGALWIGPIAESPLQLSLVNYAAYRGVFLFFNNDVDGAEKFFLTQSTQPIFSLGYCAIGFMRAMLTWESQDLAEADSRLKATRKLVASKIPKSNALISMGKSVSNFLIGSNSSITVYKMEMELISAETLLLSAMMSFLTEDSVVAFVKAGFHIRQSWKMIEQCFQQFKQDATLYSQLDPHVLSSLKFISGTFNLFVSLMPTIVLKLVSFIGFPSDRRVGLQLLQETIAMDNISHGPLAALALLFYFCVIPSFFTLRPDYYTREANSVLERAFLFFPKGSLFLWMAGRLHRMNKRTSESLVAFNTAADSEKDWLQLQHLICYELAWTKYFSGDFIGTIPLWQHLERETSWSKSFFSYMTAIVLLDSPIDDATFSDDLRVKQAAAALPWMRKAEEESNRKLAGKTLSLEEFIKRRSQDFLQKNKRPILPIIEMIYLYYGSNQLPDSLIPKLIAVIDRVLSTADSLSVDDRMTCYLIKSSFLRACHRRDEAEKLLFDVTECDDSTFHTQEYLRPFAYFDSAICTCEQIIETDIALGLIGNVMHEFSSISLTPRQLVTSPFTRESKIDLANWEKQRLLLCDKANTYLKNAYRIRSRFFFKNRLHLRIHLAGQELKQLRSKFQAFEDSTISIDNDDDVEADDPPVSSDTILQLTEEEQ